MALDGEIGQTGEIHSTKKGQAHTEERKLFLVEEDESKFI